MNNKLLKLVAYDDPILHKATESVHFPLSEEDRQIIADMIHSIQPNSLRKAKAPWEAAVGMAANQWGINKSIFLYCPDGNTVDGLEVIINPSYQEISPPAEGTHPQFTQEWEACFSVPLRAGQIKRNFSIHVKYQNQEGQTLERDLSGWEARVWQHENDHLNGFLFDDQRTGKCLEKKIFSSYKEAEKFFAKLEKENL